MIHFYFFYTDDASGSPFVRALAQAGVEHATYARRLDLGYHRRWQLVLLRMPALLWFAIRSVLWSLSGRAGRPDIVVPVSHLQALLFLAARALTRRRFSIVLLSFIYTQRQGRVLARLRRAYFGALLRHIEGAICHSELEVARYGQIFGCPDVLRFVPLGLHVEGHEQPAPAVPPGQSYAVSAGRSGRDYPTLCEAFSRISHPLRIICDSEAAMDGSVASPNIDVLDNCFGGAFFSQLRGADLVVVPLQVNDISAGQMVIIQAMALRKPIITTRTATVGHYVRDGWNALLVEKGSADDIVRAVARLLADPALARRLGDNAYLTFLDSFSMPAFARAVVGEAESLHHAAVQRRTALGRV